MTTFQARLIPSEHEYIILMDDEGEIVEGETYKEVRLRALEVIKEQGQDIDDLVIAKITVEYLPVCEYNNPHTAHLRS